MRALSTLLMISLAACADGAKGPAGKQGPEGGAALGCTAVDEGGLWLIECPDGSRAELEGASCTVKEMEGGARRIDCPDGSEAVIVAEDDERLGAIEGEVRLAGEGPSAGVHVELVGTEISALSGEGGRYRLQGIPPGSYELRFTRAPYLPRSLPEIPSFGGVYQVPTVELALRRWLGETPIVSEETELAIIDSTSPKVYDLVGDVVSPLSIPAGLTPTDVKFLPDRTILFVSEDPFGREWLGVWNEEFGEYWASDIGSFTNVEGGALIARDAGGGDTTYALLREGGEREIGGSFTAFAHLGLRPRWLAVSGGRTVLIDGAGAEIVQRELAPTPWDELEADPEGDVGALRFGADWSLFDLRRGEAIAAEGGIGAILEMVPGGVVWENEVGDATSFYDVRSGELTPLVHGEHIEWSPGYGWILQGALPAPTITSREGLALDLDGSFPVEFSPDDTKLLLRVDPETFRLVELPSMEGPSVTGFQMCIWVSIRGVACARADGSLALVAMDGSLQEIGTTTFGPPLQGWVPIMENYQITLASPGRELVELGAIVDLSVSADGEWITWTDSSYSLHAINGSTGRRTRIARPAGVSTALSAGVVYYGILPPTLEGNFFAPYP